MRGYLEAIGATGALSDERRGRLASALVLMGELRFATGRGVEARRVWQDALDVVGPPRETSESPHVRDPELRALILSGQKAQAERLRVRLDQSGYRPLRPWPSPPQ